LATLPALSYSSYLIAIMYFAPKRALAKRLLRYGYGKQQPGSKGTFPDCR